MVPETSQPLTKACGWIDLHCHLLAGLDDGPPTWSDAVALCRQARDEGCFHVAATSHQLGPYRQNTRDVVLAALQTLRRHLAEEQIDLEVVAGGEWSVDADWIERIDDLWPNLVTYGDAGRYALIEFPNRCPYHTPLIAAKLADRGVRPVLAHVDRYPELLFDATRLGELVDQGYLPQLNADALDGRTSGPVRRAARGLIRRGLIAVVASDAHDPSRRPVRLREAYATVARWTDDATARRLMCDHPRAILEGTALVLPVERGRGWLRRFSRRPP